jgi:hypothetical protein
LANARLKGSHGVAQRRLTNALLVIRVPVDANGQEEKSQSGRAPLDDLVSMCGSIFDAMSDLVDKLVVLQLSTMCSIH